MIMIAFILFIYIQLVKKKRSLKCVFECVEEKAAGEGRNLQLLPLSHICMEREQIGLERREMR